MSSAIGSVARWIVPLLGVAAVASIGVIADPVRVVRAPALILVDAANPLAGKPFYVDPASAAMVAARNANPPNAELTSVANTPQSYWLDQAFPPATVGGTVARYTGAAQAAGAMPVLTLYGIPHRDCGSYASGGFATGTDYRGWIDAVASGLGSSPATIIVEPDALAMADCLSPDQRQERFDLVRYAVDTLTRDPAAAVYVDAGHSRWLSAEAMAARLNDVGVGRARGFSLNVSNFYTTDEEIGYGEAISGLTNGSHYVIDTSRNGAGPAPDAHRRKRSESGVGIRGYRDEFLDATATVDAATDVPAPANAAGSQGAGTLALPVPHRQPAAPRPEWFNCRRTAQALQSRCCPLPGQPTPNNEQGEKNR